MFPQDRGWDPPIPCGSGTGLADTTSGAATPLNAMACWPSSEGTCSVRQSASAGPGPGWNLSRGGVVSEPPCTIHPSQNI